jgi:hypothetical protein
MIVRTLYRRSQAAKSMGQALVEFTLIFPLLLAVCRVSKADPGVRRAGPVWRVRRIRSSRDQ